MNMAIEIAVDNDNNDNNLIDYLSGNQRKKKLVISLMKVEDTKLQYRVLSQDKDIVPDTKCEKPHSFIYLIDDAIITINYNLAPTLCVVDPDNINIYLRGRYSYWDNKSTIINTKNKEERDRIHDIILKAFTAFSENNYFHGEEMVINTESTDQRFIHSF